MVDFGDASFALRLRDTIARVVREEMNNTRPQDRFGRVIDANRFTGKASVLLVGDVEAVTVSMTPATQPVYTDMNSGVGLGSMVRISGVPGNYWISAVVSGPEYSKSQHLVNPNLIGGTFMASRVGYFSSGAVGSVPAFGNTYHFGRWTNVDSVFSEGTAFVRMQVRHTLFTSEVKAYDLAIRASATGGAWQKLVATFDSGSFQNGHDFEMEIMVDATGFELRARRSSFDPGGFTTGGYYMDLWIYGDEWEKQSEGLGEETTTAPTVMFATTSSNYQKGPFLSPGMYLPSLVQIQLTGGGLFKYTSGALSWPTAIRASGVGLNHIIPGGYYDISNPGNGWTVPVYGKSGTSSVLTTSNGFPLADGEALYYEPPWGNSTTSSQANNFRIVARTETSRYFQVPSFWILIAKREGGVVYPQTEDAVTEYRSGIFTGSNGHVVATQIARISQRGKHVYLRATYDINTAITANASLNVTPDIQIGTVTTDFRPTEGLPVLWSNGARFGDVFVDSDGSVTIRTASSTIPDTETVTFTANFVRTP